MTVSPNHPGFTCEARLRICSSMGSHDKCAFATANNNARSIPSIQATKPQWASGRGALFETSCSMDRDKFLLVWLFFLSFLSSTVSDHRQELPSLSTGCPTSCSAVDASARIEVLSRLAFVPLFFPLRIPSLSYLPIVRSRPLRPSPTS
jgi:hypothetical protein